MSVLKKVATLLIGDNNTSSVNWLKMPKKRALKKLTERELLTLESEVGAKLFGPIPPVSYTHLTLPTNREV